MMKDNKYKLLLYIIGIMALIAGTVGVSYAYFQSSISNGSVSSYNISFNQDYNLSIEGTTSSSLSVNALSMFKGTSNSVANSKGIAFNVNLANSSSSSLTCSYSVNWEWDTTGDHYTKTSGVTNEYTIKESTKLTTETQLQNYGSSKTLFTDSVTASAGGSAKKSYSFNLKFYNIATIDQSAHGGKTYSGKIVISDVVCSGGGASK